MAFDHLLEFEKPVQLLENQIRELELASQVPNVDLSSEIQALRKKVDDLIKSTYENLTAWERVLLARHANRPHALDFINQLVPDFKELHGDRRFADDKSIVGGIGHWANQKVMVIGIEKGRKTQERVERNFGMPKPEGYRKALRLMNLAAQFSIPIVTLVDTPGAYPGIGAEERGQAQAIAENLEVMSSLPVPTISIILGEGGSGGALALAVTNKVFMMEYAIYSVISPESCASILWSDPKLAEKAANSLKLTAVQAKTFGVIDDIILEPQGGAHRDREKAIALLGNKVSEELNILLKQNVSSWIDQRFAKFRNIGNETIKLLT